jgi:hypothetical protein
MTVVEEGLWWCFVRIVMEMMMDLGCVILSPPLCFRFYSYSFFLLILVDVCFGFVMVMIEFNVVDWWLWVKVYYDCDGVYEVSTFFSMIQPPLL